ncbi:hypothetical protein [Burkholderia sp. HI2714]|uniref:hypothetical protein n=1 Tax=Burkholderia sp. HI2714 TaxID=2015359 RepID=UPI00211AB859|nr:hypothetical protein [Burkholderia sp. HI2714]
MPIRRVAARLSRCGFETTASKAPIDGPHLKLSSTFIKRIHQPHVEDRYGIPASGSCSGNDDYRHGGARSCGAMTGFRSLSSVRANADTSYYGLLAVTGAGAPSGSRKSGIGAYNVAGNTLLRTTVLASSNGGAAVKIANNANLQRRPGRLWPWQMVRF